MSGILLSEWDEGRSLACIAVQHGRDLPISQARIQTIPEMIKK
jgi:hypothetical protein